MWLFRSGLQTYLSSVSYITFSENHSIKRFESLYFSANQEGGAVCSSFFFTSNMRWPLFKDTLSPSSGWSLREEDSLWRAGFSCQFGSQLCPPGGLWWPPPWSQLDLRCRPGQHHERRRIWFWSCFWWGWCKSTLISGNVIFIAVESKSVLLRGESWDVKFLNWIWICDVTSYKMNLIISSLLSY